MIGPFRNGTELAAAIGVAVAAVLALVVLVSSFRAGGSENDVASSADKAAVVELDDGAVADPDAIAAEVIAASADAMAQVRSVEFEVERDEAPIFIDQFGSIALDKVRGQFNVPTRAQAELTVTIDGNFATRLGAVAIDDEVWISNPVTGDFETLPAGYDIDPSRFFDPENGWRPLLANLRDAEIIAIDDRGGDRYHVRGIAPAAEVRNVTVGLVRDQEVEVDLWIHPGTFLVTHAEFDTVIDGATSEWALSLDRYGDTFTIEPPENVRDD